MRNEDAFADGSATNLRKPTLKELAQRVIARDAGNAALDGAGSSSLSPRQARRHAEIMEMLAARPEITRAYQANSLPDGTGVITLGVRGIGICELLIPADRYDALQIMYFLDSILTSRT